MKRKIIHLYIIIIFFITALNTNYILATDNYSSSLNCSTADLFYIKSWGNRECIAGNSTIFINSNIELISEPKIILQSTDSTETQWVYIEKRGNNYYFDIDLTRLTLDKEYIFKIKSDNYNYQTLDVKDEIIQIPSLNLYVTIENNIITISKTYSSPLNLTCADIFYIKSWGNRECIAGNSTIFENINNLSITLSSIPKIILQSTDGAETQWVYVEKRGNNYYFDIDLTRFSINKEYIFKVKSNNSNNTYGYQTLCIKDEFLAVSSLNKYITIKDNIVTLSDTYSASLNCTVASLYYAHSWGNRDCIAGNTTIFEATNNVLDTIPKIVLESTDGSDTQWVYVQKNGNNYYFDIDITRLSTEKEYLFKIKSNNSNNKYGYQTLNINNGFIPFSQYDKYVTIKDNIINISDTYSASFGFDPAYLYFIENNLGDVYLAGTAVFYEQYINSKTALPPTLPKLEMIAKDQSFSQKAYVEKIGEKYFFSVKLNDIDISKTYYLQVTNTNLKNLSTENTKHVWIHSLNNNSYKINLTSYSSYLTFTQKIFTGTYGKSGLKEIGDSRGTDLKYYKIGHGENVLFATFAMHGYEDLWSADGKELTIIAEDFTNKLASSNDEYIGNNWTIYIFPQCNPDGANFGYTNNGPGRCTLTGINGHSIDMNRCWSTSFEANYTNRNYTGSTPFGAYEAVYLRDFLLEHKSKYGQTILIDLHGWTTQLIGDREICLSYYGPQFYGSYSKSLSRYTSTYGKGYLVNWARTNLTNLKGLAARSALIELPSSGIVNHTSVVNARYSQKYYNATVNMLKGIL